MTTFTLGNLSYALAIGLLVGIGVVAGFNSQHASSAAAMNALRERMGSLYTITLIASGALPTIAIWLCATLKAAPTLFDTLAMLLLIGLGMIAAFTLAGNIMKLLGERMGAGSTA